MIYLALYMLDCLDNVVMFFIFLSEDNNMVTLGGTARDDAIAEPFFISINYSSLLSVCLSAIHPALINSMAHG